MTAQQFADLLRSRGFKVKQEAGGWRAQCPAHQGGDPNMTIRPHSEGGVICTCHSHHCSRQAIAEAVGLKMTDLLPEPGGEKSHSITTPPRVFPYQDEQGKVLFEVVRESDKRFWQRLPGAEKGGIGEVRRVLFRMPELLKTVHGQVVAIAEGEKCALAVAEQGVTATTNPHGARKWRKEYTDWLRTHLPDRRFVIFPDNDEEGLKHANEVFESLRQAGLKVRIALLDGLKPKGDIADWLQTHTKADLAEVLEPSLKWRQSELDAADLLKKKFEPVKWAIKGVLPEGLAIFAGPSKSCKSWLCCEIGIAMVSGGAVFGQIECEKGETLYLALEDSMRRLQDRLRLLLRGEDLPRGLTLRTDAGKVGEGCEELICEWLDRHKSARLVIVDVLQKIRPPKRQGVSEYEQDYETLTSLQRICRDYRVAMLMVHHTRKAKADDPYDMISGSTAIQGAADTIMALMRVRGEQDATLHYTGRDVDSEALALQWNDQDCGWRLLGKAQDHRLSAERSQVLDFLCKAKADVKPSELAGILNKNPAAIQYLLSQLVDEGVITKSHYGKYCMTEFQKQAYRGT